MVDFKESATSYWLDPMRSILGSELGTFLLSVPTACNMRGQMVSVNLSPFAFISKLTKRVSLTAVTQHCQVQQKYDARICADSLMYPTLWFHWSVPLVFCRPIKSRILWFHWSVPLVFCRPIKSRILWFHWSVPLVPAATDQILRLLWKRIGALHIHSDFPDHTKRQSAALDKDWRRL